MPIAAKKFPSPVALASPAALTSGTASTGTQTRKVRPGALERSSMWTKTTANRGYKVVDAEVPNVFLRRNLHGGRKMPAGTPAVWEEKLRADCGAQSPGERVGPALDVFVALGLHHHPRQFLRAGISQHHAARIAKRLLSFSQS
jgi:hypothetical protein